MLDVQKEKPGILFIAGVLSPTDFLKAIVATFDYINTNRGYRTQISLSLDLCDDSRSMIVDTHLSASNRVTSIETSERNHRGPALVVCIIQGN